MYLCGGGADPDGSRVCVADPRAREGACAPLRVSIWCVHPHLHAQVVYFVHIIHSFEPINNRCSIL